MAGKLSSRLWLALGVAPGLAIAALLHGCGSEDASVGEAAGAERRIAEDCEPVEESLEYERLVGSRALAILSWTGMSDDAAALKIPVHVVGIEDGTIGVRFLQFPMREQYLHIWLGSGHIEAAPENIFRLHPCSAKLEPWPPVH